MDFKVGSKVQWQWMGRFIDGIVMDVYHESVTKLIKGKHIKRNGTQENPACLVLSSAGNQALKLKSELSLVTSQQEKPTRSKPSMFR
jgi:phage terminase small subunit